MTGTRAASPEKVTFVDNRTGVGPVYRANVQKGVFEPVSDRIYVR